MRAFIAINLDSLAKQTLAQISQSLQSAKPPLRMKWVAAESQHLTLQFLGEITSAAAASIQKLLPTIVMSYPSFELTFAQLGCFPNAHKPNVLWLGASCAGDSLQRLQKQLGVALARLGFAPEARPFKPHLTLARVPREAAPPGHHALGTWLSERPPPAPHVMRVSAIHLMQSELLPTGARYTPIAEFKLQSAR